MKKLTKLEDALSIRLAENQYYNGGYCQVPNCKCLPEIQGTDKCFERIQRVIIRQILTACSKNKLKLIRRYRNPKSPV